MGGIDRILGGPGNDTAFGGPLDDSMAGNPGNDTLRGNLGSDAISGGSGDDFIDGDNPFSPPPDLPFPLAQTTTSAPAARAMTPSRTARLSPSGGSLVTGLGCRPLPLG